MASSDSPAALTKREAALRHSHATHSWEKHDAHPSPSLFIDDSIQHIHGARHASLHAEHLELANEDVIGLVERLDLLV